MKHLRKQSLSIRSPASWSPKTPPEPIEEVAPDQRPEGDNVAWIPGYWGWDDERNDFLWVSGIWRALPPGRQWMPGYWAQSRQGSQWTSGYWADAQANEIQYLPEPPATVEAGPNVAAPSADDTWLPGCLGLAAKSLRLATRKLGRGAARLAMGAGLLRVDATRLRFQSTGTGIIRSRVAACCLRRSISAAMPTSNAASPTRLRR